MGRYAFIVKRLLQTIPLLLAVVLLVFLLIQVTPGDPARLSLGPRASEAEVADLRGELGLEDPLPQQYVRYVGEVAKGDLGESIRKDVPVSSLIGDRLGVTLALLLGGTLVALVIAVPLAQYAARHRDRAGDHIVRAVSLTALTMPPFWLGILLLVLIALPTGWFPISGYGDTFGEHVRALVLPCLTLGISLAPVLARSLRSALIGIEGSDYLAMARSVGISRRRLAWRHEMPNAILPVVTLLGVSAGYALFGTVVIENTFSIPGLGHEMLSAVDERDFPVVQGITLVFALIVVLVHLTVDVLYVLIDPRVEIR